MTGKIILTGQWSRLAPGVVLSMVLLSIAISACSSTESTSNPSSETSGATETAQVASPAGSVEEGKAIFISKPCIGCHTVEGIPQAQGQAGPDLTHQAGRPLIADTLTRTDENMRKWLSDPAAVKSGVLMPKPNLTDDEMDDLIAFLETLK